MISFVEHNLTQPAKAFCIDFCAQFSEPSLRELRWVLNRLSQAKRFETLLCLHKAMRETFPGPDQKIFDRMAIEFLRHGLLRSIEKELEKLVWEQTEVEPSKGWQIVEEMLPNIHSLASFPLFTGVFFSASRALAAATEEKHRHARSPYDDPIATRVHELQEGIKTRGLSALIPTVLSLLHQVAIHPQSYRVYGLFYDTGTQEGVVREIAVRFEERAGARGDLSLTRLEGGPGHRRVQLAEEFKEAVRNAYRAAHACLGELQPSRGIDQYDVVPEILAPGEEIDQLEGGSLGLAIALAIIARATDQEIGVGKGGNLAVTGEIDAQGTIKRVDHVDTKVSALKDLKGVLAPDVDYVFVPQENQGEAEAAAGAGITVKTFPHLADVLKSELLFDPWKPYLETLRQSSTDDVSEAQAREALQQRWSLLVCRYHADKRAPLDALASWCAHWRLQGDRTVPVPFFLDDLPGLLETMRRSGSPLTAVFEQLKSDKRMHNCVGMGHSRLLHQLQKGALLLLDGADHLSCSRQREPHEPLPALVEALCRWLRPPLAQTRVALTCHEATVAALQAIPKPHAVAPKELPLYQGRSNFLDPHRQAVKQRAQDQILACRVGVRRTRRRSSLPEERVTPEEFFYSHNLHVQVPVGGVTTQEAGAPTLADVLCDPSTPPRFVLLGEGGAGKSTELLKVFFDCVASQSALPLTGRFTPWLIRLSSHFRHDPQQPATFTLDGFLTGLWAELQPGGQAETDQPPPVFDRFKTDVAWTPRLLILLDGLDEIPPKAAKTRDAIGFVLKQFVAMCPDARVVVTSRPQETEREEQSLLASEPCKDWPKLTLAALHWSEAQIEAYLQRTGCSAAEARALLELLRTQPGLLRNPMLLYLFASTDPAELRGKPLSPAVLYRGAMRMWLKEEVNKRSFPFDPPNGLKMAEVLLKLIAVLALGMKERDQTFVDEADAAAIFCTFIREHPQPMAPSWWPRVQGGDRLLGYDLRDNRVEISGLVGTLKDLFCFL